MLGDQIKFYREALGYSQTKLSKMLNVSQEAVSRYEKGSREPDIETLKNMCRIFDCSLDEICEFETTSQRKKVMINHSFNHSKNINVKL